MKNVSRCLLAAGLLWSAVNINMPVVLAEYTEGASLQEHLKELCDNIETFSLNTKEEILNALDEIVPIKSDILFGLRTFLPLAADDKNAVSNIAYLIRKIEHYDNPMYFVFFQEFIKNCPANCEEEFRKIISDIFKYKNGIINSSVYRYSEMSGFTDLLHEIVQRGVGLDFVLAEQKDTWFSDLQPDRDNTCYRHGLYLRVPHIGEMLADFKYLHCLISHNVFKNREFMFTALDKVLSVFEYLKNPEVSWPNSTITSGLLTKVTLPYLDSAVAASDLLYALLNSAHGDELRAKFIEQKGFDLVRSVESVCKNYLDGADRERNFKVLDPFLCDLERYNTVEKIDKDLSDRPLFDNFFGNLTDELVMRLSLDTLQFIGWRINDRTPNVFFNSRVKDVIQNCDKLIDDLSAYIAKHSAASVVEQEIKHEEIVADPVAAAIEANVAPMATESITSSSESAAPSILQQNSEKNHRYSGGTRDGKQKGSVSWAKSHKKHDRSRHNQVDPNPWSKSRKNKKQDE